MQDTLHLHRIVEKHGGAVLHEKRTQRPNFECAVPPGDGYISAVTLHVSLPFSLLGRHEQDFLSGVFPRLSGLERKLTDAFRSTSNGGNEVASECVARLMPYPREDSCDLEILPKLQRESRGTVCDISELTKHSEYYQELTARYAGLDHGVITNNGTVVGPDGGIVGTAVVAATTFHQPVSLLEFGGGACSTATALLSRGLLNSYCCNDFSKEIEVWFNSVLAKSFDRARVACDFEPGSCFDAPVNGRDFDIVSIGIYYQAQPEFFAVRGCEMRELVGDHGVLIAQCGMTEDVFVPSMLTGSGNCSRWPWYRREMAVTEHFDWVASFVIEGERMILASNNVSRFNEILKGLNKTPSFRSLRIA